MHGLKLEVEALGSMPTAVLPARVPWLEPLRETRHVFPLPTFIKSSTQYLSSRSWRGEQRSSFLRWKVQPKSNVPHNGRLIPAVNTNTVEPTEKPEVIGSSTLDIKEKKLFSPQTRACDKVARALRAWGYSDGVCTVPVSCCQDACRGAI